MIRWLGRRIRFMGGSFELENIVRKISHYLDCMLGFFGLMQIPYKTCRVCGKRLVLHPSNYSYSFGGVKNGYAKECRDCIRERQTLYRKRRKQEKENEAMDKGGVVYFIRNPNTGLIKIGKTVDLERRFKTLQSSAGQTLELLGTQKGYTQLENFLHDRFYRIRANGEWFLPEAELFECIGQFSD